ncbi:hypothetical protein GWK36_09300 [Caldichromatium japonicum]|uniref:Uncharacterized protein n=1 Tax=Caldichromatium japonicum TaxID=2699430 RepID=A0A6G7VDU8_9GAMM|nr:hypothetical protein [Caldichromatium japonicum]QIK38144.1 hypothetical protein GWK36_09300 [Caldichromatium japonicum]
MLPPIDLGYIAEQLDELGEELCARGEELDPPPETLLLALRRMIEVLQTADGAGAADFGHQIQGLTGSDPELILSYGIQLLTQLAGTAERMDLPQHAQALERLTLPLSLWMLRRGCELSYPEPVVNALAHLANHLHHAESLIELYGLMNEILESIGLERALASESGQSNRPCHVLLINRAIVATRTRQPELMDSAFRSIADYLPDEAPAFFREGMSQIEGLDYPAAARTVMEHYFTAWCTGQRLH